MKRILFLVCLILHVSCLQEQCETEHTNVDEYPEDVTGPLLTRAGEASGTYEVLPNPYAISVMQAIYDEYSMDEVQLSPTDLYVRFMPQDSLQLRALIEDENLELFEYPLDVVLEEGEEYINPELEDDELNWLYTTVKPDFVFPSGIPYTVLEECYIPQEDEKIVSTKGDAIDVEHVALQRMGFRVDTSAVVTKAKVYPSGTIQVLPDTSSNPIPVKGVKVRCNNVVKWSSVYTDENGQYTMDKKFKTNVHYAVVFDNVKDFDVWGNRWPVGRSNYNMGWHNNLGHSTVIDPSCKAWKWAAVNNAAYDYYVMCEETGIPKPPPQLKIWVWKNTTMTSASMIRRVDDDIKLTSGQWYDFFVNFVGPVATAIVHIFQIILPDINIGTSGRDYNDIYSAVNHELSHASHFTTVGSQYWAKYINYIITYGSYGDGTGLNAELCGIGEMWGYSMENILLNEYLNISCKNTVYPGSVIDGWIKPMVFWDLYANDILDKKQIYDCLAPDVDTYEELINKMVALYPEKEYSIKMTFVKYGIIPDDVDIDNAGNLIVNVGSSFDLEWAYATGDTLHDIEYSLVREKHFDESSDANIIIQKDTISKYRANITILDYGYYVIEANVVGTEIKRYLHVAKYFHPYWEASNPLGLEGRLPAATEMFTGNPGAQIGLFYNQYISFGTIAYRTIAIKQRNIIQLTTGGDIRPDRRTLNVSSDTLKLAPQQPFTINLPNAEHYMYEWTEAGSGTYTTESAIYYAIAYPSDICEWRNNY